MKLTQHTVTNRPGVLAVDLSNLMNTEVGLVLLGSALIAAFLGMFVLYLLFERDATEAGRRTAERGTSTFIGALSVSVVVLAEGLSVLAEAPGLVMSAVGLGAVLGGWNWDVFLAVAFLALIVMTAVRNGSEV
jgi:hypothetical protein